MIGPQVAFVDDVENQINVIKNELVERHTGTVFFDATPDIMNPPERPIESVEILFLDLFYNSAIFDAEKAAQWVQDIIPENKKYTLIIWSRDTYNHTDELLEVLEDCNLTPAYLEEWQKTDTDIDIPMKLNILINRISTVSEETILGEVVEIEDDGVLIRCRLGIESPTFQVRKFDLELLSNFSFNVGTFVRIQIVTKPGTRLIDFYPIKDDLTEFFKEPDFFEGLEGNSFFLEG